MTDLNLQIHPPVTTHIQETSLSGKAVLLLHGAGVAGQATWGHFVPMLKSVSQIVIPDMRGMGAHENENAYKVDEIVADMQTVLDNICAQEVVLVGYSFGGLVAMLLAQNNQEKIKSLVLIEPASLERECFEKTQYIRQQYQQLAQNLSDVSLQVAAVRQFIDLVCPNRPANRAATMKVEAMMIERLLQRPQGFANALNAVSNYLTIILNTQSRTNLIKELPITHLFSGANSSEEMINYHQELAKSDHITQHVVAGTDHTLPYQKPRSVAKIINQLCQV